MSFFTYIAALGNEEAVASRDPSNDSQSITYRAIPITEPAASIGFLKAESAALFPSRDGKLWLQSIAVASDEHGHYLVTGEYGPQEPKEPLFSSYRASGGNGTANLKYSLETIDSFKAGGGAADEPGGILGWDGPTNPPRGMDVPVPGFVWVENHFLPQSIVTRPYLGFLRNLRTAVNDAPWKGFAAGEAQFIDFTSEATIRDAEDDQYTWAMTYVFECQPNQTNIQIGDITIPFKEGWDHIETRYNYVSEAGRVRPKPYAAYVERNFLRADFAAIGIGTT